MGKRVRKIQHPKPRVYASSGLDIHPDATLDPEASLDSTYHRWMGPESTTAQEYDQTDRDEIEYATGGAALLDKFLHGGISLPLKPVLTILVIGWFVFISWLYIQDNQAGRLENTAGFQSFGVKSALYSILFFFAGVLIWVLTRSRKK